MNITLELVLGERLEYCAVFFNIFQDIPSSLLQDIFWVIPSSKIFRRPNSRVPPEQSGSTAMLHLASTSNKVLIHSTNAMKKG